MTAKEIAGGGGRMTMALTAFVVFVLWCVGVAILPSAAVTAASSDCPAERAPHGPDPEPTPSALRTKETLSSCDRHTSP